MKRIVLFLIAFVLISFSNFAQNDVQLNIHHKLGEVIFLINDGAKNNMDHTFNTSRLEYYISGISIIHDGGLETPIDGKYILVDASQDTEVALGNFDITEVEAIHFHIGVDEDANHSDPASYPAAHPLAPQFPSMHWGWAAGYRFLAFEGMGGPAYNQLIQLHGLGDDNYFKTEIPLTASAAGGLIEINLDADYTRALEDIAVNAGVIVHGETLEAKQALENFRDYVFSPSGDISSAIDISEITRFEVYPNPTFNTEAEILLTTTKDHRYDLSVTNILGRQIQSIREVSSQSNIQINLPGAGLYFVNLIKDGQPVLSKKLIAK